ncbi:hypothetical protein C8R43DRAFT_1135772 [Mycena crocata]|nr:hypothetical protein C8R43DRAFT_1135772 [Mycena crocata]
MLFSTALLFAALVPTALCVPSPAPVDAKAASPNPQAIAHVQKIIDHYQGMQAAVHTMELKNPHNPQLLAVKRQVAAVRMNLISGGSLLGGSSPLSGTVGQVLDGQSGCLSGLLSGGLLGNLLGGTSTSGLVAGLLDPNSPLILTVNNLLNSLGLGGLLGGLNLGNLDLNGLLASLLGGVPSLSTGCGCGVDPVTALVGSLQGLVYELLALLGLVQTCGCGSNPALLAVLTPLLSGL